MADIRKRSAISRQHRLLGLFLSIPLLAWMISAFVLHYYGLVMPNGLQGVYDLKPWNSVPAELSQVRIAPTELLKKLRSEHNLERIYTMKLQAYGPHTWYIVQPDPFAQGMVFDANSGERLDPLSGALLRAVADEALAGTRAGHSREVYEYHRDYRQRDLPAQAFTMTGEQPTELVLLRATGRTLRRSDNQALGFNWWYKVLHVFQWGNSMAVFTTVLYILAALVVVLAVFGLRLWYWRRGRPGEFYSKPGMRVRLWHRRLGLVIGSLLIVQMLLGAYMWLSLGPLQDPFRGKDSFNNDWSFGIATTDSLAHPAVVLQHVGQAAEGTQPVQVIQWRRILDHDYWLIQKRRDEPPVLFDAETGAIPGELTPEQAGEAARQLVAGMPDFEFRGKTSYYYNDFNRKIPAYHYRFADPAATDIFVARASGDIISRRPRFWRAFSPILMFHAYAFTGNKVVDTLVLTLFQFSLLGLITTGLLLARKPKSSKKNG